MTEVRTTADPEGLGDQAEMLRDGRASSLELVERALERIAATQETLNAFRCVRAERAREEAVMADRRLAAGEERPLLGVPVAIKDDMDLAGESTNFGCEGEHPVRTEDGEVARRLKAAGAVIVGKTNTPELGQWPITEGPAFGKTRNPWSLEHSPGGSSGGSAVAVAGRAWSPPPSGPTVRARSGSRPRGPTSSGSSRSAGGFRPCPRRKPSTG